MFSTGFTSATAFSKSAGIELLSIVLSDVSVWLVGKEARSCCWMVGFSELVVGVVLLWLAKLELEEIESGWDWEAAAIEGLFSIKFLASEREIRSPL